MPGPLPTDLPAAELAIATHDLSKQYEAVQALTGLGLQVPEGAVYLLVGPNGAGKSTTIKILLDLIEPTSGTARVLGLDPRAQPALVRANVGYVPEQLDWGYAWMRTGRLLGHGCICTLVRRSDRSRDTGRVDIGPPILYVGVCVVAALLGYPAASQSMLKLFSGFYGAGAAMGGTVERLDAAGWMVGPSAARWIGATALWGAVSGALLYVVARRRHETTT